MPITPETTALLRALLHAHGSEAPSDPLIAELVAHARLRTLAAEEVLCGEGEPARAFWIVQSGTLRVEIHGVDGAVHTIDANGPGSLVGESALLRGPQATRNATLVANEPTVVVEVDTAGLDTAILERHGLHATIVGLERFRSRHVRETERRRLRPPHLWRTLLFLPQFAFDKAYQRSADCFIVDLQDAVPLEAKQGARAGLLRGLANGDFDGRPVVVRINETALPAEHAADLDAVVGAKGVVALMPTMMEHPDEVDALDAELTRREAAAGLPQGHYRLIVLMETPAALLRAEAMARAGRGRVAGLLLGHGDLCRLTGAETHAETTMDWPRNQVVFAARAAGIAAFDTPYTAIRDLIGLEREAQIARRHGFDGKACVHPSQLAVVERCLRPSIEQIAWARRVEATRQSGALQTLVGKVGAESLTASGNRHRTTDGMALVDGQLVGPPHIKAAQRLLQGLDDDTDTTWPGALRGRVVGHALPGAVGIGDELPNPYELTITPGMRDLWQQCFYGHDPVVTSAPLAAALGLSPEGAMPAPFMLALYLAVSMSSTHGAMYHLGFRGARQHLPLCVGETVRQRITMLSVRNTSDGKRAVVTTRRALVRTRDEAEVFRVDKLELYPAQPAAMGEPLAPPDLSPTTPPLPRLDGDLGARLQAALAARARWADGGRPAERFEAGEVLLHTFARPLGISANLSLSTLFLVTHPIHLDHHRFDVGEGRGIVVSGGLVIALTLAAVSRDISHVIAQELVAANNLRPVAPTETVGALSRVLSVAPSPASPDLEVLVVRTLGVRQLTPGHQLADTPLPPALFDPDLRSVEAFETLCRERGLAALEGRIVCDIIWRVLRLRPAPARSPGA